MALRGVDAYLVISSFLAGCSAPAPLVASSAPTAPVPVFHVPAVGSSAVTRALDAMQAALAAERALRCTFTVTAEAETRDGGTISGTHSGQPILLEVEAIDHARHTARVRSEQTQGEVRLLETGGSVLFTEPTPSGDVVTMVSPFKAATGEYTAIRTMPGPTSVARFGTCASR